MTRLALVAATLSTLCCAAVPSAGAALATPSTQPAELQALEQRMSGLTLTSERVKASETIEGRLSKRLSSLHSLTLTLAGELSVAPPAVNVTVTVLGQSFTLMQIGDTFYLREPSLARLDGGRPWVKEDKEASGRLFSSSPSLGSGTGVESNGTVAPPSFKSEAALLKAGVDVRSLGPSTVAGQATSGFAGSLDAAKLAKGQLPQKLIATLRRQHAKLIGSFEAFVAPDGVPVRMSVFLALGKVRLNNTTEVLATNFPVAPVPAPPAAQTISAAELAKLELALSRKRKHK